MPEVKIADKSSTAIDTKLAGRRRDERKSISLPAHLPDFHAQSRSQKVAEKVEEKHFFGVLFVDLRFPRYLALMTLAVRYMLANKPQATITETLIQSIVPTLVPESRLKKKNFPTVLTNIKVEIEIHGAERFAFSRGMIFGSRRERRVCEFAFLLPFIVILSDSSVAFVKRETFDSLNPLKLSCRLGLMLQSFFLLLCKFSLFVFVREDFVTVSDDFQRDF